MLFGLNEARECGGLLFAMIQPIIYADGTQRKGALFLSYGEALTYALDDIITNWKPHRKRYEGEMNR